MRPLIPYVIGFVALTTTTAQAQEPAASLLLPRELAALAAPYVPDGDFKPVDESLAFILNTTASGQTKQWGIDTGLKGSLTTKPVEDIDPADEAAQTFCRGYTVSVATSKATRSADARACRGADGVWKIVE
jgi:hypothetical protein